MDLLRLDEIGRAQGGMAVDILFMDLRCAAYV